MFGLVPRMLRRESTLPGIRADLDRLFEDMWRPLDVYGQRSGRDFVPKIDIAETKDAVEVEVELPGLGEDEVDVSIEDNHLTISGEKKDERKEEEKDYRLVEISYGRFERIIHLPDNVDGEKIKAEFKDGVLKITAPKTEASKPRKIELRS